MAIHFLIRLTVHSFVFALLASLAQLVQLVRPLQFLRPLALAQLVRPLQFLRPLALAQRLQQRKRFVAISFALAVALLTSLPAQLQAYDPKLEKIIYPKMQLDAVTPGLQKKGFTKYKTMMKFLRTQILTQPNVKMTFIGKSPLKRKIPLITVGTPNANKVRVWFQGGLHGNEPASTEGMLYLLYQMVNNPQVKKKLSQLSVAVLPMANIDGYQEQNRFAALRCDLNRDQTRFSCPEAKTIKQALVKFNPHIAIDFHEYTPYRPHWHVVGKQGAVSYYDVMFLYTGNLNVPAPIRQGIQNILVRPTQAKLKRAGFSVHDYFSTRLIHNQLRLRMGSESERSSATNFALGNSLAVLMEIRGVRIGRTNWHRRIRSTYVSALSFLEIAAAKAGRIKAVVQEAVAITRSRKQEIIVRSRSTAGLLNVQVIDRWQKKVVTLKKVPTWWLSRPIPTLTRSRPQSYLILPKEKRAIRNLQTLGVQMKTLTAGRDFLVEAYQIVDASSPLTFADQYNKVQTKLSQKKKFFPKGTKIVAMNQGRANYVAVTLEPEAPNSFVSNGTIQVRIGSEYSVYRYNGGKSQSSQKGNASARRGAANHGNHDRANQHDNHDNHDRANQHDNHDNHDRANQHDNHDNHDRANQHDNHGNGVTLNKQQRNVIDTESERLNLFASENGHE